MGSNLAKRAMPLGGLKKLPYFLLTTCYIRAKTERKTPKQKQPFAFTMSKGIQSIKKDPQAPYKIPLCVYIAASITDDDCKKTLIGACDETDFIKVIHVANSESKTSSMTKMDVDRWYMLKNFSVHVRKLNQVYLMTNEKCTVRKTSEAHHQQTISNALLNNWYRPSPVKEHFLTHQQLRNCQLSKQRSLRYVILISIIALRF